MPVEYFFKAGETTGAIIEIFIEPLELMANDRMEICLQLNQNHQLNVIFSQSGVLHGLIINVVKIT